MNNFAGVFDDKLIFSTKIQRANHHATTLSWDSLFTSHGFVVPYGLFCFNAIDKLDDESFEGTDAAIHACMLVKPNGRLYDLNFGPDGELCSVRLIPGKGFRHVRSADFKTEELATAAFHLINTPEEALSWYHKTVPSFTGSYLTLTIDEIVAQMKERGLCMK
ncbi:hypothetical protein TOTORO_00730 [Serratia phage vB_SmaS-Totoro]|nr:hypothetical protein TOTORO_00730 [Serratia phage vB_SmaS-Totoro]